METVEVDSSCKVQDCGSDPSFQKSQISNKIETFKKPQLLIGPQRGKDIKNPNKLPKVHLPKESDLNNRPIEKQIDDISETKETVPGKPSSADEKEKKAPPPLQYKEPTWCGIPTEQYTLEELKSGTIVKTVDLTKQSFHVFGRLENCDIPMLHPTVSRYHAVLQYRAAGDSENEAGFYIYDLGSSLGTFLNKQKLKPKTFVRVKVGYVLKVGCSTRMFILQGPPEDEEPESELTVTELKQQYKEKLAALEAEQARREAEEEDRLRKEDERGIDWGMGEDADEETDLTENPYASTQNEELYLDDPKKTLRGWFEREGEELEYDIEEKGFGHFLCRIELPVDNGGGGNLVAEASVKGKKKEAVVQAALEACRLLDRQGLLRQSTHESKKKAAKDWEAVDFYDSDEDNFLDRTGQIEKKRQQRMAQTGKLEKTIETYDTLLEKYNVIVKELEQTERKLHEMMSLAVSRQKDTQQEEDDLDAYMNTLQQAPVDKIEIKKMKGEVIRLRTEEGKLRNLVNIARPTELPKLEPAVIKFNKEKKPELLPVIIRKKPVKKRNRQDTVLPLETTQQQTTADILEEELEEDDEIPAAGKEESDKKESEQIDFTEEVAKKKKKKRPDTRNRSFKKQIKFMKMGDEDYSNCTWTPPAGQTGDGRTSLNDKLGY